VSIRRSAVIVPLGDRVATVLSAEQYALIIKSTSELRHWAKSIISYIVNYAFATRECQANVAHVKKRIIIIIIIIIIILCLIIIVIIIIIIYYAEAAEQYTKHKMHTYSTLKKKAIPHTKIKQ